MSTPAPTAYAARLDVDYPDRHDRVTTFFRVVLVIPIAIVIGVLTAGATRRSTTRAVRWSARRAAASSPASSWPPC